MIRYPGLVSAIPVDWQLASLRPAALAYRSAGPELASGRRMSRRRDGAGRTRDEPFNRMSKRQGANRHVELERNAFRDWLFQGDRQIEAARGCGRRGCG